MKVPYKKSVFEAQIDYKRLIENQANTECNSKNQFSNNNKVMKKTRSNKRMPNARRGV